VPTTDKGTAKVLQTVKSGIAVKVGELSTVISCDAVAEHPVAFVTVTLKVYTPAGNVNEVAGGLNRLEVKPLGPDQLYVPPAIWVFDNPGLIDFGTLLHIPVAEPKTILTGGGVHDIVGKQSLLPLLLLVVPPIFKETLEPSETGKVLGSYTTE
jgi:hypothetical protein